VNAGDSPLIAVTAGGVHWQVAADLRDLLLGPSGLRLEDWLRGGCARVVKERAHRTVYHVGLPGLEFFLKQYRLTDTRSRLRQLLRPAKARMEFDRALAVARRKVATITPLGLGEACGRPGESFLITRRLLDVEPLSAFIESTLPMFAGRQQAHLRQRLAEDLGGFLAAMHQQGISHPDLHPGNLLVGLGPGDQFRMYLIDLHNVRLGPSLGWAASRADLVILNRWFVMRASRPDRRRFFRAYCSVRGNGLGIVAATKAEACTDLERRTWASNLRFWSHRDRRCLATNRYFRRVRTATAVGYAVRDLDPALLADLLADPDGLFHQNGVRVLKDSPSSTVIEFKSPTGPASGLVYKRFRVTTWGDPLLGLLRRSPAIRSWVHGHGLRERRLPTARPLVVFHRRRRGLGREGYLLTEAIPGAVDLHQAIARLRTLPSAAGRTLLRQRIEQVARLVRELHRCQLSHRDLKAANILVQHPEPEATLPREVELVAHDFGPVWLIDLAGMVTHRRLPWARCVQNLARLGASFFQDPALTRADKLRFLRVYLQWGLVGRGGWKKWWRAIDRATQAKVDRNRRSGRLLA
jgi:serine/threonine protein kinase